MRKKTIKRKSKKENSPYNFTFAYPKRKLILKNFFEILLPLFLSQVKLYYERCKTNRAEQHLVKQKGAEKLPSPKTQAVTQKELHAIADEAIGNAKKIYIHYTPLEGAMVIKLLF